MGYDRKYGKVTLEFGDVGDDEPVVVFRARDVTVPNVLQSAAAIAASVGSPPFHVDLIHNTRFFVQQWQQENPSLIRVPTSATYKKRIDG